MFKTVISAIRSALGFSATAREELRSDLLVASESLASLSIEERIENFLSPLPPFAQEWAPLAVLTWGDETAVMTSSGCWTVTTVLDSLKAEAEQIRDGYDVGDKMSDEDVAKLANIRTAQKLFREAAARRNWLRPELRSSIKGSVPAARLVPAFDFVMASGVHLMVGEGASGKSYLAQQIGGLDGEGKQSSPYGLLRVGEPLSGYDHEPATNAVNLLSAMFAFDVVVVDSVKDLLSMGGAAMKSGISRSAVAAFSPWSSMACDLGVAVVAIVNISSPDEAAVETIVEAARSNATSVIVHVGDSTWNYFTRRGEGLFRRSGKITMHSEKRGGGITILPEGSSDEKPSGRSVPEAVRTVAASYTELSQAIRRALSNKA